VCKERPKEELKDSSKEMIDALIGVIKDLVSSKNNSTIMNNNNNTTITNNIQINLKNYGNEDISHMTKDFLDDCCVRLNEGMKNLVEQIHFNPDMPENHNIKWLSNKQNMYQVFVDGHWHAKEKCNALDELIKKGYKILAKHFFASENAELKKLSDQIQSYLFSLLDRKSENYYQLRRELHVMVYDNTIYVLGLDV
jgi:hypothetical protein